MPAGPSRGRRADAGEHERHLIAREDDAGDVVRARHLLAYDLSLLPPLLSCLAGTPATTGLLGSEAGLSLWSRV